MNALRIVIAPEIQIEIDEAALWLDRQEEGLGDRFLADVKETLLRIQKNPEIHPILSRGIRRAPLRIFSYGTFYRLAPSSIFLIGVLHVRRNPAHWQSR